MALDDTPLDTDVATFAELLDAVRAHMVANPDDDVLLANDTGEHLNPNRIPRLAIRVEPGGQVWTIPVSVSNCQIIPLSIFRYPEDRWLPRRDELLALR